MLGKQLYHPKPQAHGSDTLESDVMAVKLGMFTLEPLENHLVLTKQYHVKPQRK
jgi:hypothetical protein